MKKDYIPSAGDILWVDLNPRKGHEQSGKRPALVISTKEFSRLSHLALICPITTTDNGFPLHRPLPPNLSTTGFVMCEHIRSIDFKLRGAKYKETVSDSYLDDILRHVLAIMDK